MDYNSTIHGITTVHIEVTLSTASRVTVGVSSGKPRSAESRDFTVSSQSSLFAAFTTRLLEALAVKFGMRIPEILRDAERRSALNHFCISYATTLFLSPFTRQGILSL